VVLRLYSLRTNTCKFEGNELNIFSSCSLTSATRIAASWIFMAFSIPSQAYELGPRRFYQTFSSGAFNEFLFSKIINDVAKIETTFWFSTTDKQRIDFTKDKYEEKKIYFVRFEQHCIEFASKKCLTAVFRGDISLDNYQGVFLAGDLFVSGDAIYRLCQTCSHNSSVSFMSENGDEFIILLSRERVIFVGSSK
jgi:hypothetical protein